MGKGLGIGALVLAIVCIFIPLIGPWLTIIAAFVAMFAKGPGFGLAIGAVVVNLINLLFLSPTTWVNFSGEIQDGVMISSIWLGSQVLALVILIVRNRGSKAEEAEEPA